MRAERLGGDVRSTTARYSGVVTGEAARDPGHEREHAHALLDLLAPERLTAVRRLLEVIVEPLEGSVE
jgi:hypothetical protein